MVSDFSSKCKFLDDELLELNQEGLIPGPKETEEAFSKRIALTKASAEEKKIPSAHLEWTALHLKELFDFSPRYLPIFYSNASLFFWEGGCCWIEEGIVALQLRKGFKKGSYLRYSRDELIAHEAVHAARGAFEELTFEEVFAYFTSEKKWRRVLGPMIHRPWEVWPFLMGLGIGLFFPLGMWGATCWLAMGFGRLIRTHRTFKKGYMQCLKVVKEPKLARALLFRLTDGEIHLFAKGEDVLAYAANQTELRWRLIRLAYLRSDDGTKS